MFIQVFPSGPLATNTYVAACTKTRKAAIFDPALDCFEEVEAFLDDQKLSPQMILLTHSHWDHIADVYRLKEKYKIPIYIHSLDSPNLLQPGTDGLPFWLTIPPVQPDVLLEEGMEVPLGELKFRVLHTPGHSPGCVCFYEPEQHVLFSGDTLFRGAIGNLSLPTGQPSLMRASLTKLAQLPLETRVFPGHGSATTIGAESSLLQRERKS
jgi:hydroxyacylglutathione hydrolase